MNIYCVPTRYMKQVSADGKLLDSATPSPKESPSHAEVRCKLPEMGGVSESRPRGLQGTGAFKNLHIVQGRFVVVLVVVVVVFVVVVLV